MQSGSIIDSTSVIEDLLAERGITVSYESIRLWCNKFGPKYANRLKKRHQGFGDTFYIYEVFVKIGCAPQKFKQLSVPSRTHDVIHREQLY